MVTYSEKYNKREERNISFEDKFRAYMFRGTGKRYFEICKNLNVLPNTLENRQKIGIKED